MDELVNLFTKAGGQFVSSPEVIAKKLKNEIKVYLFDWDGVFNGGIKGGQNVSLFAEPDAMGVNLLRFSHWMENQELPFTALVTGANNKVALELAQREHFHAIYLGYIDKGRALEHLVEEYSIKPHQVAYVFDDALDLPVAEKCGLRFLVKRPASPVFSRFVINHAMCDYITGFTGENNAVREICELIIAFNNNYETTLKERLAFSELYLSYFQKRQALPIAIHSYDWKGN
ncbi:phosphatase [Xanthovirga aplysinae]|uniref:phosphatase n=1 Tax=Xanthovirga aplysinae TaxID=2529853 RepID=UPI0012BD77A6|nr:phosphatase [Xanthovirga aplysinae]MTI30611.1 phosphatase [Xanthovirga aplysinae]